MVTGPATTIGGTVNILNGQIQDSTTSGATANYVSQCSTDSFSVTNGGNAAPVICGTNSGEHSE